MEQTPSITRREYNRQYHRKRYQESLEKGRSYSKSLKVKQRHNIDQATWDKYREHLADVIRLADIVRRIPADILAEVIANPPDILGERE